jgi:hypothetical protein
MLCPRCHTENREDRRGTTRSRGVTSGIGSFLGGLKHRAEGLERQRAFLPRVVSSEEQHREGRAGLVPAPQSPLCLRRGVGC